MRNRPFALIVALAATVAGLFSAHAIADESERYIAVVTGDNVYVRSGAADSYYPFGRVNSGDLVMVTGEKFNWGRVLTVGPTFTPERFFGYIVYPTTQPGRFRLAADGKSGTTLGRADVLAPNLNTNYNPNDSWKPLVRLDANTRVEVIETTETANNTVHKIVLPANAEAWISAAYLRRATPAEREQWEKKAEAKAQEQEQPKAQPEPTPEPRQQPKPEPQPEPTPEATPEATPEPATPVQPQVEPTPAPRSQPASDPRPEPQPQPRSEPAPQPAPAPQPQATPQQTPAAAPRERSSDDEPVMPELPNVAPEAAPQPEVEAKPTLAERLANASLEDLEQAYEQLRKESIETSEVNPLREMFLAYAERVEHEDATSAAFARARANQLELWADVQQRRAELAQLRERARIAADRTEAARLAVDAGGDYVAVGRLAASTIYDGRRLPKMLRLQDPGTGRTVAYVEPDAGMDMVSMLGQLIGVVGEKSYDGALRLNVVQPRRIDILAPQ